MLEHLYSRFLLRSKPALGPQLQPKEPKMPGGPNGPPPDLESANVRRPQTRRSGHRGRPASRRDPGTRH
eukprot:7401599-Alexandrium_andersonii.AAC.1